MSKVDADLLGVSVLGDIGQQLAESEVRGRLDRGGQPITQVGLYRGVQGTVEGQRPHRVCQTTVGEDRGVDPSHQVTLKSSWDLPHDIEFDIDARYIGALPNPAVPAYWGLDARVGWRMTDHLELALSGTNLAGKHTEFGPVPGGYVFGPTVLLALKWKP